MKRFLVMVGALVVLAAACGGTTTGTFGDSDAATASEEELADAPLGGVDLGEDGVLRIDDFIPGFAPGDFDESDSRASEFEIQHEIAVCMAAEGFEYVPFVPSGVGGGFGYDEFEAEGYVKQFGFGVSTWVLQDKQFIFDEESGPWASDPNQAIVDAMDDAERQEYARLLYGGEPDIITNTPPEEIEAMSSEEMDEFFMTAYENWEPDGCLREAYDEAEAFYDEFADDLDGFYERAHSDPRIVDIQKDWPVCMAKKGHDFATREEMYAYFWGDESGEGEFSRQVNELITWPEVALTDVEDLEGGEEPDYGPERWAPQYDIELLQPFIDYEILVATADHECSQGMYDLYDEIYTDLERQFIEENMQRLLAYKDANP